MNTPSARLSVSVADQSVWIRICGRANFTSSIDFKTLVNELRLRGYHHYHVDLSECVLMDSTFLGVLAGCGLKMGGAESAPADRAIELLNPNARLSELLENLGVLHLFKIVAGPHPAPNDAKAHAVAPAKHSQEEVTRTCLEAHQTLMDIAPDNIPKFKEVTQFLAEDLKKLKTNP